MFRFALCLAIVASFTLSVRANVAPFGPTVEGMKRVECEYVAQSDRRISGYRFYLFERSGPSGILVFQEEPLLGLGQVVPLPGSYDDDDWKGILAVPDRLRGESPINEYLTLLLSDKEHLPTGVALHTTGRALRELPESDTRREIKNLITISMNKDGVVNITAADWPHAPGPNPTANIIPIAFTILAGLTFAGAMVGTGLWFFRRNSKS